MDAYQMIYPNIVSDKSIWQQLLPCKYQNPMIDGQHSVCGQRGQAVPVKPPTFSSAKLSLPPFCPKGLEFPTTVTISSLLWLTLLQSTFSEFMQVLVPKIPHPAAISHHSCMVSDTTGFPTGCSWVGEAKTVQFAQQCRRGMDGAEQSLSPLPVLLYRTPYSNTACFVLVKSDELFSQPALS